MSREAFEKWWPSVGQTIGKVAAWEAWQAALQGGEAVGEVFDFNVALEPRDDKVLPILYEKYKALPAGTKLYTTPQLVVPPLTLEDLNLIRQWHNAVKDAYVNYLQACDADTFAKIEALLSAGKKGGKMSIAKKLIKPTCEAHRLHNRSVAMQAKEMLRQKEIDSLLTAIRSVPSLLPQEEFAAALYDKGVRADR